MIPETTERKISLDNQSLNRFKRDPEKSVEDSLREHKQKNNDELDIDKLPLSDDALKYLKTEIFIFSYNQKINTKIKTN